ncbi:PepSY domain-containing protein [Methylosinus sporium]|uniref:PepSY domain-containing protein n=1 Tax=Methylosinus sporium TaxID=428 RepID=A0A549SLS2_METSR|nr:MULTISPECIES: PepSY domain-containing protein [Methylosinus]MBU3887434.1 PepSY domain-containing protein [Methylosinus sp. KRF6]TRL30569.1 PepSY domain-containing protein [Methylosinus sporium]
MRRIVSKLLAFIVAVLPPALAPAADRPAWQCLTVAETRQLIADRRLGDPFALMQAQSNSAHAEPINARLCREQEDLVYEISLLRRDGRVMRIYLDAATGQPHAGHKER